MRTGRNELWHVHCDTCGWWRTVRYLAVVAEGQKLHNRSCFHSRYTVTELTESANIQVRGNVPRDTFQEELFP